MREKRSVPAAAQQRVEVGRACRACARSPSRRARARSSARGRWNRKKRSPRVAVRLGVLVVQRVDALASPARAARRRRAASRAARRGSRSAARSAGARRGWRGSAPRALRPAPRRPARSPSIVGTTTSVRDVARDAVRDSPCAAAAAACTSSVASQLTSATASWLADAAARRASATSHAPAATRDACACTFDAAAAAPSNEREQRDRAEVDRQRAARRTRAARSRARGACATAARSSCARGRRRPGSSRRARARARRSAALRRVASPAAARRCATSASRRRLGQRLAGDALDHVPVAVARGEIHARVDAGRVLAQRLLDDAQRLDELAPVHRAEEAQAADAVADRDLVGGLLLALGCTSCSIVWPAFGSRCSIQVSGSASAALAALQAARRARRRTALVIGGSERAMSAIDQDQALRVALGDLDHAVGPDVGEVAVRRGRRPCAPRRGAGSRSAPAAA